MIPTTAPKRSKGSAQPRKITNDRITIEALKFYVPMFHIGDKAATRLLEAESLTPGERNNLENRLHLKELAIEKITSLCDPLITRELQKIISASHLSNREDLFDMLYYAGINGLSKGLRHFEVDKINKSSTNYIFQWITTYAKKELTVLEAPYGIAPSRFQKYKKISAVRKRLSEQLGRYAENHEVLEYFHSGKADIKTMNGRVSDSGNPSQVNLNMSIESIEEQENFEKNLSYTTLIDPVEDYSMNAEFSEKDRDPFFETTFGIFINTHNLTDAAKAVFMSDLTVPLGDLSKVLEGLDDKTYKRISSTWKVLLTDVNGPFYHFLKNLDKNEASDDFDVDSVLRSIEKSGKVIRPERWSFLFEGKKVKVNG